MAVETIPSLANSLTASITSAINSLAPLDATHDGQIQSVVANLQNLATAIASIQVEFSTPTVTCIEPLREQILQSLSHCSQVLSPLLKQVQRLDEQNAGKVNGEFWHVLGRLLASHSRLFDFYGELLRKEGGGLQSENVAGPYREEHISQVSESISQASRVSDIFSGADTSSAALPIRQRNPSGPADPSRPPEYGAPPAYSPTDAGEGPSSSRATESRGWLGALASVFRSKPEPFVPALCEAIARGDVPQAQSLISQGVNMNGANENGDTPVKLAILNDQLECLELLLASGADIKVRKEPALFFAAKEGRIEAAKLLLQHGASVDLKDTMTGQSYLVGVVKRGNVAGMRLLLENGASANTKDMSGQVVIATAVSKGYTDVVELLLHHGADASSKDISGQAILAVAISKNNMPIVHLLLARGADANGKNVSGARVLAMAVAREDVALTTSLLDHGADANGKDTSGNRALCIAVNKRNLPIAALLLKHGADPNAKDIVGQPVIISVIKDSKLEPSDKVSFLEQLLDCGVNADAKDAHIGKSALSTARTLGNTNVIQLLIKFGAKE